MRPITIALLALITFCAMAPKEQRLGRHGDGPPHTETVILVAVAAGAVLLAMRLPDRDAVLPA